MAIATKASILSEFASLGYFTKIELFGGCQPTSEDQAVEPLAICHRDEKYKAFIGEGVRNGVASWFRGHLEGHGCYIDGSVGSAGCDLNLASVNIKKGALIVFRDWFYLSRCLRSANL